MKCVLPIILSLTSVSGLYASQSSLITRSPFLPNNYTLKAESDEPQRTSQQISTDLFILKGIVQLSGTFHFSIFDRQSQQSTWITLGETFNGLTALEFDHTEQQLIARYNNIIQTITLDSSEYQSRPVPTSVQTAHSSIIEQPSIANRRPSAFRAPTDSNDLPPKQSEQNEQANSSVHPYFASTYGSEANIPSPDLKIDNHSNETDLDSLTNHQNSEPTPTRFGIDQSRISKTW